MPTTYLDLTNKLLRRLNEVEIAENDFPSVRGVQSFAKDAISAAIEQINQSEVEWPFNAATKSVTLVPGQIEYPFATDLRSVKWRSFTIKKDAVLNTYTKTLENVGRDYWEYYRKEKDLDSIPDGIDIPYMVFDSHGFGFGVSPCPNAAYTLCYDYFKLSPPLVNALDKSTIPSVYDEAIIQGGLYHFYMFRSDSELADRAEARFKKEVEDMRTVLIDQEDTMRNTMRVRATNSVPIGYMY